MSEEQCPPAASNSKGIMIDRGAQFSISNLRITIGPDGALDLGQPTFSLSLDLTRIGLR